MKQTDMIGINFDPSKKPVVRQDSTLGQLNTLPKELQEAFGRSKQYGLLKALGCGSYCIVKLHDNLIKLGLKEDGDSVKSFIVDKYGVDVWSICDDLLTYWMKKP